MFGYDLYEEDALSDAPFARDSHSSEVLSASFANLAKYLRLSCRRVFE